MSFWCGLIQLAQTVDMQIMVHDLSLKIVDISDL